MVKVTSFYDYLGMTVSCFMKWRRASVNIARKANKTVNVIKMFTYRYNCTNINLFFMLFDRMVMPILLYGAEVWGTEYREDIERVQTSFCKFVLGLGSQTSDLAVG